MLFKLEYRKRDLLFSDKHLANYLLSPWPFHTKEIPLVFESIDSM